MLSEMWYGVLSAQARWTCEIIRQEASEKESQESKESPE